MCTQTSSLITFHPFTTLITSSNALRQVVFMIHHSHYSNTFFITVYVEPLQKPCEMWMIARNSKMIKRMNLIMKKDGSVRKRFRLYFWTATDVPSRSSTKTSPTTLTSSPSESHPPLSPLPPLFSLLYFFFTRDSTGTMALVSHKCIPAPTISSIVSGNG